MSLIEEYFSKFKTHLTDGEVLPQQNARWPRQHSINNIFMNNLREYIKSGTLILKIIFNGLLIFPLTYGLRQYFIALIYCRLACSKKKKKVYNEEK